MRVLMIVDSAPPLYGGAGSQAALLAARLRQSGVRVRIFARQKERVAVAPPGSTFVRPFIGNVRLSAVAFRLTVFWRVLFTHADVIHCHGAYPYSLAAVIAARLRSKPTVVKVTLLGSDDPATIRAKHLGPLRYGNLEATVFTGATRVIALNQRIREAVLSSSPDAAVTVIPNGVALAAEPIGTPGATQPNTRPHVVYVGVLSARKGTDTLLAAWPAFRAKHADATLTLVGPIGRDVAALVADADRLSSLGIRTTGLVPSDSARAELSRGTVFVLPSREEGQPNSLIEAMALGLATCASDIPVNVDTGRGATEYFTVGDAASLTGALDRAWSNRRELGQAGRERAAEFDITAVAARYEELYRELATP